jgi:hypothetical protein
VAFLSSFFGSVLTPRFTVPLLAILLATAVLAAPASAQVPRTLHYQATLVEDDVPAEGPVDVDVAFYDAETDGSRLAGWTEAYTDVPLDAGRLQLLLGSQVPLPEAVFEVPSLYLELAVDGEVLPRLPVASTAFALRAGVAEAVTAGSIPADALVEGAVTRAALAEGAVTAAALDPASVTTPALADAAVTGEKIGEGAVATSHLADNAVTSGKLGPSAVVGDVLADAAVTSPKLANGAVTASKVASGQLVTSLNGLTDGVRLIEGDNVDIEGIEAPGGGRPTSCPWRRPSPSSGSSGASGTAGLTAGPLTSASSRRRWAPSSPKS